MRVRFPLPAPIFTMTTAREKLEDLAAGLDISQYDVFYSALKYLSKDGHVHDNYVNVVYNQYFDRGVFGKIPDRIAEYVDDVLAGKAPILVHGVWTMIA